MPHNIFANALKISIDIEIAIPQHRNPPTFQKSVANRILRFSFVIVMLRTVKFYLKFRCRAIKIHDIGTDHFLSFEIHRHLFQKIIP